jgi:hypothetical protein
VIRLVPALLGAGLAAAALPASAECVTLTVDVRRSFREAAVVFAGTIVHANNENLTFRPDRVWKGRPSNPVTIHVIGRPNLDGYRFRTGERHLVFADVVGPDDDPDDLPAGVLAMTRGCGAPPWPLTLTSELDRIARPRAMQ